MQNKILFETNPDVIYNKNPMVRIYGKGLEGVRCKQCKHLYRFQPGQNAYLKCELRPLTHGPGTDHRANWDSCSKYEGVQP